MDKKIMIWGADGGIGAALYELLTKNQWRVLALGRRNSQSDLPYIEADVSDRHTIEEAVYSAGIEFGEFDALVYTIGDIAAQKLMDTDEDLWQQIMDANLNGVYRVLHASLPIMKDAASIIVIGAITEKISTASLSAYAASKAGLETLMTVVAKEDRKRKYLLVRPLAVDTPFWEKVPYPLPKSALAPGQVAEAIIDAIETQTEGRLDIP